MELDSEGLDSEYVSSMINDEMLVLKNPRMVTVKYQGKVQRTKYFRAKLVNIIGCYGTSSYESRILNQSETLIIVSDYYIRGFCNYEGENVKMFRPRGERWVGKSLIDKQFLIYYVKDSVPVNVQIWEKFLDAVHLGRNEVTYNLINHDFSRHYDRNGVLIDMNKIRSDNLSLIMTNREIDLAKEKMNEKKIDEPDIQKEEVVIDEIRSKLNSLKDLGVDESVLVKYKKKLFQHVSGSSDSTNDSLYAMLETLMTEEQNIKALTEGVKDIIKKKREKQFLERVFELPGIFAIGTPSMSSIKNRALKDVQLRTELESIASGLTNQILSNRLTISPKNLKMIRNQLRLCRVYSKINKSSEKNKNFFLDIITMILNDADIVLDSESDDIWSQIMENMTTYIVDDENTDSDSSDSDVYDKDEEAGRLNYEVTQ
jgi:hypothetical protein